MLHATTNPLLGFHCTIVGSRFGSHLVPEIDSRNSQVRDNDASSSIPGIDLPEPIFRVERRPTAGACSISDFDPLRRCPGDRLYR